MGVFAAIGGFEGMHPLGDFVVGDGGESLEIAAHHGVEVHGRGVRADFSYGRSQVHDGVVFGGNRSVS